MLVPGLGPHRVVDEFVPIQVEMEINDGRRNELARSQQAAQGSGHAQLQPHADGVGGGPSLLHDRAGAGLMLLAATGGAGVPSDRIL